MHPARSRCQTAKADANWQTVPGSPHRRSRSARIAGEILQVPTRQHEQRQRKQIGPKGHSQLQTQQDQRPRRQMFGRTAESATRQLRGKPEDREPASAVKETQANKPAKSVNGIQRRLIHRYCWKIG